MLAINVISRGDGFSLQVIPNPRKSLNWNCPWVKRDGSGLRSVFRPDKSQLPVHTSHNHFYRYTRPLLITSWFGEKASSLFSEPHSILEPGLSEEEVRAMQKQFFEEQQRLIEEEQVGTNLEIGITEVHIISITGEEKARAGGLREGERAGQGRARCEVESARGAKVARAAGRGRAEKEGGRSSSSSSTDRAAGK